MFPDTTPARNAHFRSPAILAMRHRSLYEDGNERLKHRRHMEAIALDLQRPVEVVALLYERILMQLKPHASVHDFLPIFVAKLVKQHFKPDSRPQVLMNRSHSATPDHLPGEPA